jgi:acyl-CoA thioesterase I
VPPPASGDFVGEALAPFWRTVQMWEPVLFRGQGIESGARLLFSPSAILTVTNPAGEQYELGRDYATAPDGSLWLPAGSRIPFRSGPIPERPVEGGFAPDQALVTYRYAPGQWKRPIPVAAEYFLPRTLGRLRSAEPLRVLVVGDSIASGMGSSHMAGVAPHCPPFPELVAEGLRRAHGSAVALDRAARGGWNAAAALAAVRAERLGRTRPDLVLLALGMNDVVDRNPSGFRQAIRSTMDAVLMDAPDTEVILVSSALGNPAWPGTPEDQFPRYRDALQGLAGPGVAHADVTSAWQALLERKSFYDLTANGVNHPNDFGHLTYARVILSLLT